MKIINIYLIIFAVLFTCTAPLSAQLLRSAYFMENTHLRTSLNPALTPERGFLTIPLLGSFHVAYASNNIALSDIFYNRNGRLVTFLDPSVGVDEFLKKMKSTNQINADFQYNLFQAGWYKGSAFWTLGLSVKTVVSAGIPKGMFEFVKRGTGASGAMYDISNLRARADVYAELALGYSRPVNDRLTVGGKFKLLPGVGNIDMRFKKLHAELNDERWFITSKGEMYGSIKGMEFKTKTDENIDPESGIDPEYVDGFDLDGFGLAGFGAAVDLGASYKVLDNLAVSASLLDFGFISWSSSATRYAKADAVFEYDGFDLPVNDGDAKSVGDQLDDMKDELERLYHFNDQGKGKGRSTMLAATLAFGAEYTILDNKIGFGLLSTTKFYRPKAYTELTASVNFRPKHWFSGTLSYSMVHSAFNTYGLAMNFGGQGFNFFIGSDYMITKVNKQFIPVNARAENLYFGLSVGIGKNREESIRKKAMKRGYY